LSADVVDTTKDAPGLTFAHGSVLDDQNDAVSKPHPLPPPGGVGDPDWDAIGECVDKPPPANGNPMVGHNHKEWSIKLQIRPLAFPSRKRRRISAEIGDKLHFVTVISEHMLQLVWMCSPDRSAIVALPLNKVDHFVDISANESRHRRWPAEHLPLHIAAPHGPQRRFALNWAPALRWSGDLDPRSRNDGVRGLDPIDEPARQWI
jgi:hypothetical protein